MSPSRLLILGVLKQIQPAHGYRVRQTLELWEADRWANIAYGSIYHALSAMQREGLLFVEVDEKRSGGATKKSYRLTEIGEKEYVNLLRMSWHDQQPVYDPFQVALTFLPDMPKNEVVEQLKRRVAVAQGTIEHLQQRKKLAPPHVVANLDLAIAQQETFCRWAAERVGALI